MYDNRDWLGNFWFGYVIRHCRTDYISADRTPLREKLNPLRYEIGFGKKRPCKFVWNRKGRVLRAWSDLNWRVWKRKYYELRGRA